MIASASKDKRIIVWRLDCGFYNEEQFRCDSSILAVIGDHEKEVWRVSWNLLGTVLASSGDDNVVRVFKRIPKNDFKCVAIIKAK